MTHLPNSGIGSRRTFLALADVRFDLARPRRIDGPVEPGVNGAFIYVIHQSLACRLSPASRNSSYAATNRRRARDNVVPTDATDNSNASAIS